MTPRVRPRGSPAEPRTTSSPCRTDFAVVYVGMGRDRDAATAAGGFIGFGLGAMPVGLAVMRSLNARFGDTPRAILAVTLAASLVADTVNALVITGAFGRLGG